MKDMNKDNESFAFQVDRENLMAMRKAEKSSLELTLNDDNKKLLLENIQGHLILCTG